MATAYITHPDCLLHEMGTFHPESPERLRAIDDRLIAAGLMDHLRHYDAPLARDAQITRVHTPGYLQSLRDLAPHHGHVVLDPDTSMNPHSLSAALHAAGALILATDLVMAGTVENAFCAVRPPGHHAEPARAMGFCLLNNIAIGVAHALAQHGLQRIAIIDFDVHHGNGTEVMFRHEPRVLLCSSFQHPFYPHTPLESRANLIEVPLRAGSNGAAFRAGYEEQVFPAVEKFAPQMIFVSAGFDGHIEDEMASLALSDDDYTWVTQGIVELAQRHAKGRIVSTLEGGYALNALGRAAARHIKALMGI
ncbi:MAG TPA: histone deacetylase family protein [Gammaproteobacteria bacterium]